MTHHALDDHGLDLIFRKARTHNAWLDKPVTDDDINAIFNLMKFGPTSANCFPARFVFVKSKESKERLKPHLAAGNVDKTMGAPLTVIIAHDLKFYDMLPKLFPHTDARSWFVGNDELIRATAMRNGSLQGAYLMLAARALGFDCGPMSGFDAAGVKKEFFAGQDSIEVNFICNIGHGDASKLYPQSPRPDFAEICKIV